MPIKLEYRGFTFVFDKIPSEDQLKARYDERIEALQASSRKVQEARIRPADRKRPLPMTSLQERFWFMEQAAAGGVALHITHIVWLAGELDTEALRSAFEHVIHRHEVLRTSFERQHLDLVQVVHESVSFELLQTDQRALYATGGPDALDPIFEEEIRRPFRLDAPPLIRARVLALSDDEYALILVMHHIAGDGWSLNLLLQEVLGAYRAIRHGEEAVLPELPIQFGDFAVWQRASREEQGRHDDDLAYWREQLSGVEVVDLPTDRPRPTVPTHEGAMHRFGLSADVVRGLWGYIRDRDTTLFQVLVASFQVLLARTSGQNDVSIGSVSSGRNRSELEHLVGCFINNLVIRTRLDGNPSFDEALTRSEEAIAGARQHEIPFDWVIDELSRDRNMNDNPLFRVMLIQDEFPDVRTEVAGLKILGSKPWYPGSHYDVTLFVEAAKDDVSFCFRYSTDLFEPDTIAAFARSYQRILEQAVRNADTRVSEFRLLGDGEFHELVRERGVGPQSERDTFTIHHRFEVAAATHPERVVLSFDGGEWTYEELDERANAIAGALRQSGVGPDDRVGICIPRSPELLAGLLGIMKAGGAYVALQPDLAGPQLRFMAEDAGLTALVCTRESAYAVPWEGERVLADELGRLADFRSADVEPENLAYILYTSGTTGYPKGVEMSHGAVANLVSALETRELFDSESVVLWKTPVGFDVSVSELFNTVVAGGRLVVAPPGAEKDPHELVRLIREHGVNTLRMVPTALHMLTELDEFAACDALHTVICAGEALSAEVARRFFERSGGELYNLLGATETCVDTTFWRCIRHTESAVVPVGEALENYRIYVLDNVLEPVPARFPGAFFVAGDGLARGYRRLPRRTALSFLPDPHSVFAGGRMYRTGDVVRWNHASLEYIGRDDHQLQIRGVRVELSAVEAHLAAAPGVEQAAVRAVGETSGRAQSLAGYVVPLQGTVVEVSRLREYLAEHLPDAAVPSHFVELTTMPRTASGKIDRKALPEPSALLRKEERKLPSGETEERIAAIWRTHLGISEIGVDEDFFEVGGHSLLAVRIQADLQDAFGIHISVAEFLEQPTIAGIANCIVRRKAESIPDDELARILAEIRGEG